MKKNRRALVEENLKEIAAALAQMQSADEIRRFIGEIWTESECRDIALRWLLMKLLAEGVPQRTIARELGVSLCKITRGSKYMKDDTSVFRRVVMERMQGEDVFGLERSGDCVETSRGWDLV